MRGVLDMSEQGIGVLNHSLSCVVGDLSREILHRSSQEESATGLGWCRDYEGGHILRWDEVRHRWGQNSGDEASE